MSPAPESAVSLSTGPGLEGKTIVTHLGIVAGEATGSGGLEAVDPVRSAALSLLSSRALARGANAVVSVHLDHLLPGAGSVAVVAYGTAVVASGLDVPPGFNNPARFFIMLREVEKGPFTEEQLRELLASSHLTPQTLCRLETESVWRILAKTIRLPATEA